MIKEAVAKLIDRQNLTADEVAQVMDEIMSGEASDVLKSAYLVALHMKGETVEEITSSALGMRKFAAKIDRKGDVLEIVGTGGDKSNSFNISTTSSIVLAAAGIKVAKHGNRAASSKCGAADVLESLGVNIMLEPEKMQKVLDEIGICFMHAQVYHKAMRFVGPIRKELGIPTVFNLLGPLTSPADANMQVLGVYSEELVEPMAKVLVGLGVKSAMVVYGQDCLDEISMSAPTSVCEYSNGEYKTYVIEPEQFGFKKCTKAELVGGTPDENAEITRNILNGTDKSARRNAVVLNVAAGIHVATGTPLADAVKLAEETIDSGKALAKLNEFIEATNK
jgi:anthranilate phosphoribosyltransferase